MAFYSQIYAGGCAMRALVVRSITDGPGKRTRYTSLLEFTDVHPSQLIIGAPIAKEIIRRQEWYDPEETGTYILGYILGVEARDAYQGLLHICAALDGDEFLDRIDEHIFQEAFFAGMRYQRAIHPKKKIRKRRS